MKKHLFGERNPLPQWQNIYIGNTLPDEHGYLNTSLKGIEVQGLFAVGIFQGTLAFGHWIQSLLGNKNYLFTNIEARK